MTPDWQTICKSWHSNTLSQLIATGKCFFVLRVYQEPRDEGVTVWEEPGGLSDEGRASIRLMGTMFKVLNPAAVLTSSQSLFVSLDTFGKHFGLKGLSYDEFIRQYRQIMDNEFGGKVVNLPQELVSKCVVTTIKGPKLMPTGMATTYHLEEDRVVIGETRAAAAVTQMVPDWWEAKAH